MHSFKRGMPKTYLPPDLEFRSHDQSAHMSCACNESAQGISYHLQRSKHVAGLTSSVCSPDRQEKEHTRCLHMRQRSEESVSPFVEYKQRQSIHHVRQLELVRRCVSTPRPNTTLVKNAPASYCPPQHSISPSVSRPPHERGKPKNDKPVSSSIFLCPPPRESAHVQQHSQKS